MQPSHAGTLPEAAIQAAVLGEGPPESALSLVPALPSAPREPNVYEDYFMLGTIPFELCPLHCAVTETVVGTSAVDPAPSPPRPIVIERTFRGDGKAAIVMRGGGYQ